MLSHEKQLIPSEHDYYCQFWGPNSREIEALEAIQRAFVWRVSGIHDLSS